MAFNSHPSKSLQHATHLRRASPSADGLQPSRCPDTVTRLIAHTVAVVWRAPLRRPGLGGLVAGHPVSADRRARVRHLAGHGLAQCAGSVPGLHPGGGLQQPPGAEMVHHRPGLRPELRSGHTDRVLVPGRDPDHPVRGLPERLAAGPLAEAGRVSMHPDRRRHRIELRAVDRRPVALVQPAARPRRILCRDRQLPGGRAVAGRHTRRDGGAWLALRLCRDRRRLLPRHGAVDAAAAAPAAACRARRRARRRRA